MRWKGETVFCIASGPSLTPDDVAAVRGHGRVVVCNTTFRLAPWADALVAVDEGWWRAYGEEARKAFAGEFWTTSEAARDRYGIQWMRHSRDEGLTREPGVVRGGGNTGQAAVQMAYLWGASQIILLGFDMQRTGGRAHWHPDHKGMANGGNFVKWAQRLDRVGAELRAAGVETINCTRQTALKGWPRASLESVIEGLHRAA